VQSSEDGRYSYFMNNAYNIIITDEMTGQIAYFSSFKIQFNIPSHTSLRRFNALKDNLEVSLKLSRNIDHADQFRIDVDDGLRKLGIAYSGVISEVTTSWVIKNGFDEVTQSIDKQSINLRNDGIELLSAKIKYYDTETTELLYTLDIVDISDGEDYSTAAQEEAQHNATKVIKVGNMVEKFKGGIGGLGGVGNVDGMPDVNGYGQVGGGLNPNVEYKNIGNVKNIKNIGLEFDLGGAF